MSMPDLAHGARWWKMDFHTHTPFSTDTPWHKLQGSSDELSPEAWIRHYIDAGLDCVAITDHNGGGWIDKLKDACDSLRRSGEVRQLHLFPGVEISTNGGVHLLAIFDVSATTSTIDDLLSKCGYEKERGNPEPRTSKSLREIARIVEECGGIPIPAHVDRPNGLLHVLEADPKKAVEDCGSTRDVFGDGHVFAVEVCDLTAPLPVWCKNQSPSWPRVVGSDSHTFRGTSRVPGSAFTWVKMGRPTLDGLRLALREGNPGSILRHEVQFDPNVAPAQHLQGIEVRNACYAGRDESNPLCVEFSPWLTALIGGRGSGKSTIVQMIRLVLENDVELPQDLASDYNSFKQRGGRNRQGALTDSTTVVVKYVKDGQLYRLQYKYGTPGVVVERSVGVGTWEPATGTASDFPVSIYSQKQIYSLATETSGILNIIDKYLQPDFAAWERIWKQLVAEFGSRRAEARAERAKGSEMSSLQHRLETITQQLRLMEDGDSKTVLQNDQKFQRHGHLLDERLEDLQGNLADVRRVQEQLLPTDLPPDSFRESDDDAAKCYELLAGARSVQGELQGELRKVVDTFHGRITAWKAERAASAWTTAKNKSAAARKRLAAQLTEAGAQDLGSYELLSKECKSVEAQIGLLVEAEERAKRLDLAAHGKLAELTSHREALTANRRDFVKGLTELENVKIDIVGFGHDPASAEEGFRRSIAKSDATLASAILDEEQERGLLVDLYANSAGAGMDPRRQDGEMLRRIAAIKERCLSARLGDNADLGARLVSHLQRLPPEQIEQLETWYPPDSVRVEFKNHGGKWTPLENASAGQKSAAVLAFVLSHGSEPLILDQPEDDLDNHLIYHLIVKELSRIKRTRQVIVATHNPNIVVNGDAELVNSMQFTGSQITCDPERSGCLQEPAVRDEVCLVMEGGREAFERRYQRVVARVGEN